VNGHREQQSRKLLALSLTCALASAALFQPALMGESDIDSALCGIGAAQLSQRPSSSM